MKEVFFKSSYDTDAKGLFGVFGGAYVPEMLVPALDELAKAYEEAKADPAFEKEIMQIYKNYVGRPSPLYFAKNLTEKLGGAKIYIKNEGLNHTGAHKKKHFVGQALLTKSKGQKNLITHNRSR